MRLATLFILLCSIAATAETAQLSWKECVNRATENNAELSAARNAARSARYTEYVEDSAFFPQIGVGLSAARDNLAKPVTGGFFGNDGIGRTNYGASLNFYQNLFAGFETTGKVGVKRGDADAAEANLKIIKARISFDLKNTYQSFLTALEKVKLTDDIIQRQENNLRLVELRFQSGREDRGSLLISRANLEQARYDELLAKNQVASSQLDLAKALGLDDSELMVHDPVPVSDPPATPPNFAALAEQLPEFQQAQAVRRGADSGIQWARSGFFPHLDFTASANKGGDQFFPDTTGNWAVGLTLNIPLFNGFHDKYAVEAAKSAAAAAESNLYSIKRGQTVRLRQAFSGFTEAVLRNRVDQRYLEAANLRAELGRAKYKNGLLNFEEWNIIEADLISRQKASVQSQLGRVVGEAGWEQAMGRGVIQ